jgi:hypothetical protein
VSQLHDLCRRYNDRIAQTTRSGEIEWVVAGDNMKLVHTQQFERENGLRMKSGAEQERRKAQYRQGQADMDGREMPMEQREPML